MQLAFSLFPISMLLLTLEIGARLYADGLSATPTLGWAMQPGLSGYRVEQPAPMLSFSVDTNEDGLRTALPRTRTPERRIITFGDSTVFGWGLSPEEAPAGALEMLLGEGWEVVNAGQPGFSSEQVRRLAERVLPLYQPDGILWFQPWHDVVSARATDRALLPPEPPLWTHSALLRRLSSWQPALPATGSPLFPFIASREEGGPSRVPPEHRAENLKKVQEMAASQGAWMIAALLPTDTSLSHQNPSPLSVELSQLCASLSIPFVDTSPALSGVPIEDATLPGDTGHYTARANLLLMAPVALAVQGMDP